MTLTASGQVIEIKLGGRGGVAIVDADISPALLAHAWRVDKDGYAVCSRIVGSTFLHRQIAGAPKGRQVDHIDRDRLNNRRTNLRLVTPLENALNKSRRAGTSRFRGVAWVAKANRWQVYLNQRYIGLFVEEFAAAEAWLTVAGSEYGEIAIAQDRMILQQAKRSYPFSAGGRLPTHHLIPSLAPP